MTLVFSKVWSYILPKSQKLISCFIIDNIKDRFNNSFENEFTKKVQQVFDDVNVNRYYFPSGRSKLFYKSQIILIYFDIGNIVLKGRSKNYGTLQQFDYSKSCFENNVPEIEQIKRIGLKPWLNKSDNQLSRLLMTTNIPNETNYKYKAGIYSCSIIKLLKRHKKIK